MRRSVALSLLAFAPVALSVAACAAPTAAPPVPSLPRIELEPLASGVASSLRGLSVVDAHTAWASGAEGAIGRSVDGGATWSFRPPAGLEERDFRDVHGFSAERALALAVGSPGLLLETVDGGATWTERWRDERPETFLDGLDCAGGRCVAFGDPIDGRFVLLLSEDEGRSWRALEGPAALPGEAAFAASGRSIRLAPGEPFGVALGTGGGSRPRLLLSADGGATFRAGQPPLAAGSPSKGVFALARLADGEWVAVGGDYRAEGERAGTAARSEGGGTSFCPPVAPPAGYRSAVEALPDGVLIATGPNGTDLSADGGASWSSVAAQGFHVVAASPDGALVLLAGSDGRLARLVRPVGAP